MRTTTTAPARLLTALLLTPIAFVGCENSNSPDQVTAPAEHDGHDHADHDSPDHTEEKPAKPAPPGRLYAADYAFTIPAGWTQQPPSNTMRLTELVAPKVGTAVAPVAAFSLAGGPIDANIDRWKKQFAEPDPVRSNQTRELAGTTIHLVEMAGTYSGMSGLATKNTVMRAAIVERPGRPSLFIKMIGGADAMDASAEAWNALIESITSP